MTLTTIKVPAEVRDVLKELAGRRGQSLGAFLAALAKEEQLRAKRRDMVEAMKRRPPDESYRRETEYWDAGAWI